MTTMQLQCFLTAAETLNFTTAAKQLFVSQPTLSRQIATLEQELQIQLFERSNNVLRLSPAGVYFSQQATLLLGQIHETMTQLDRFQSGPQRCLRVGLMEDQLLAPRLQNALSELIRSDPAGRVQVELIRGNYSDLLEEMNQGMLDLCQVLLYEDLKEENWGAVSLLSEQPCLAIRSGMISPSLTTLSLPDLPELLGDLPIIAVSPRAFPEQVQPTLPHLSSPALSKCKLLYAEAPATLSLYITSGLAAAFLNPNCLVAQEPGVDFIPIDGLNPIIQGCIWQKKNHSPLRDCLISILTKDYS